MDAVIADLIDQLGYALREFYMLGGKIRQHLVPTWAWYVIGICALLVFTAMVMEWYIVRRKLAVKRIPPNKQSTAFRSKALMLVDSMGVKRDNATESFQQRHYQSRGF